MLSTRMENALNDQISLEMESAFAYLGMSLDMRHAGFNGAAGWLRQQSDEEMSHAFKIIGYVQDRLGMVRLQSLDAPSGSYEQPLDAFRAALKHEKKVTGAINGLIDIAREENDTPSENLLAWFADEQVEEEATATAVITRLEMAGSNSAAILMVDSELASRTSE